jgi:hypothetical protein
MDLRILKAKQDRALNAERLAKLGALKCQDPRRLSNDDWLALARASGIPALNMLVVRIVESKGAGFDADGRATKLYEPHVAYKLAQNPRLAQRKAPRLFYPKWIDPKSVPVSEFHIYRTSQAERWDFIKEAAAIDFMAAIGGASWGMFQVLGKWGPNLGFRDAFHMVEYMHEGEAAHAEVFLRYCRMANVLDALRRGDWWTFTRYNSPWTKHRRRYLALIESAFPEARRLIS